VTEDGRPVAGATIHWATSEGSITPSTAPTDAAGFSSARWRLQFLYAQQVAAATLAGGTGTGVRFTAIATPDPSDRHTVLVGAAGEPRFTPSELTVMAGDTVNWFWPEGSAGHNVVPDAGGDPPQSGPLVDYPRYHSFRFDIPGVYAYHCMAHGAVGGVGMSGVVTVLPAGPEPIRR
jgi:plastocyanin